MIRGSSPCLAPDGVRSVDAMSTDTDTDTRASLPALESGATAGSSASSPQPIPSDVTTASGGSAFSITSLVLSGASILLGQGVLAVAGLVFGFLARSREPGARAFSTWGIVLGFVSLFGWILVGAIGLVVATPFLLGMPFLFGDWSALGAMAGDADVIDRLLELW